jgi:MoaA/NifB/PqqE/SkfB family radical SAM enzyme
MFTPVLSSDLDSSPRMLGWQHSRQDCKSALDRGEMLHLLAETTNRCNQDCEYCYTVLDTVSADEVFHAAPLPGELSLQERIALIDVAADLGAKTYDIVGAGEPLIDPLCLPQIEHAVARGLQPVVFTNGSTLGSPHRGRFLAQRLWELGATVVVKHHGSADIHDRIVRRKGAAASRDRSLALLMELGFNACTPTRLGIDNIIYQATLAGIPDCLRWCRANNVYLVCSSFIPSGRTRKATERAADWKELGQVFAKCRKIDAEEFGILHSGKMPFVGSGSACTQYLGLYVTILGEVHGCVGKAETYGNVRNRPMSAMWQDRLPQLRSSFTGGCPPRQQFYGEKTGGLF